MKPLREYTREEMVGLKVTVHRPGETIGNNSLLRTGTLQKDGDNYVLIREGKPPYPIRDTDSVGYMGI